MGPDRIRLMGGWRIRPTGKSQRDAFASPHFEPLADKKDSQTPRCHPGSVSAQTVMVHGARSHDEVHEVDGSKQAA
jgi:hypothetical protein